MTNNDYRGFWLRRSPMDPKILEMVARTTLESNFDFDEVLEIYQTFSRVSPGGKMTYPAFRLTLGLLGMLVDDEIPHRIYRAFDADADGWLNFTEFAISLGVMLRGSLDERLEFSYRILNHRYRGGIPAIIYNTQPDVQQPATEASSQGPKYNEGLTHEEFLGIVNVFERTRNQLVGLPYIALSGLQLWKASAIYFCFASPVENAREPSLKVEDFKTAVKESPEFLEVLGISLGPRDENMKRALRGGIISRVVSETRSIPAVQMNTKSEGVMTITERAEALKQRMAEAVLNIYPPWRTRSDAALFASLKQAVDDLTEALNGDYDVDYQDTRDVHVAEIPYADSDGDLESEQTPPHATILDWQQTELRSKMFFKKQMYHDSTEDARVLRQVRGALVHFGHESWDVVLTMMTGIRLALGRVPPEPVKGGDPVQFMAKEKFSILRQPVFLRFKKNLDTKFDLMKLSQDMRYDTRRGGKRRRVLPEYATAVRFFDYAPHVFQRLRNRYGVATEQYMKSFGPEHLVANFVLGSISSLSEQCSEGKSGAFFYYSRDGRFLIKTITTSASKIFRRVLPGYYEHHMMHPDSMFTKYCGLHSMRLKRPHKRVAKLYFLVMVNCLHAPVEVHVRYDLKGSREGRFAEGEGPLKDGDLKKQGIRIHLGSTNKEYVLNVLRRDVRFFITHGIMDYSLLVGVHRIGGEPPEGGYLNGVLSADRKEVYYFGLVDMLTKWTALRYVERNWKVLTKGRGSDISCMHPAEYGARFLKSLENFIV